MKTTIDIADNLFRKAKQVARRDGTTLKSLVDEGLERVLREREQRQRSEIELVTFGGEGLAPEWRDRGWDAIRDEIHGVGGSAR